MLGWLEAGPKSKQGETASCRHEIWSCSRPTGWFMDKGPNEHCVNGFAWFGSYSKQWELPKLIPGGLFHPVGWNVLQINFLDCCILSRSSPIYQCRRRSGGGRTTCTGVIAANRTTTTGRSTGTYQLSRAVRSTGLTGQTLTIRLWYWWSLVVRSYGRDRSTSTETGAAVPGTPKLLSLFHDVLLLSESPNNHPEYTAPGLLNDPLNLRCDVTVCGALTDWSY